MKILSATDAQRIHDVSLGLLEEMGIQLDDEATVNALRAAGASAGHAADVVRIPRGMIEDALAAAPSTVDLADRQGGVRALHAQGEPHFWTTPSMYIWDEAAGQRREITRTDLAAIARVGGRLGSVQGVMGTSMTDVPPVHRDFVGVRTIAENCPKHVRALCFTPEGTDALVAMNAVFPGPWLSIGFTAHSPLRWTQLALQVFARSSGHGIPVTVNGEPLVGVSAPVTLAGAMAVGNAEILAGITLLQLSEPGRPLIYNLGLARTLDMGTAGAVTGGPEVNLFAQASAVMGRFYNLPSASWVSTEALYEDEQAGSEKALGFMSHATAGVNLIWGVGQLEASTTVSLPQMVMDDQIIQHLRRTMRGVDTSEEAFAVDLIRNVGIGGGYLETEHTLTHFRDELWTPDLFNRQPREDAPPTLPRKARERVEQWLTEDPEPSDTPELRELRRLEADFEKRVSA